MINTPHAMPTYPGSFIFYTKVLTRASHVVRDVRGPDLGAPCRLSVGHWATDGFKGPRPTSTTSTASILLHGGLYQDVPKG